MGENDENSIIKDATFQDKDITKCLAILYWDPTKSAFMMSVKHQQSGTWDHHCLKTKTICYDLKKEAGELSTQHYKDQNLKWMPSALFDQLNKSGKFDAHSYTLSSGTSSKIANIYVY